MVCKWTSDGYDGQNGKQHGAFMTNLKGVAQSKFTSFFSGAKTITTINYVVTRYKF